MASEVEISQHLIEDGLTKLGIKRGDLVFLHSNLKSLAPARDLVKLPNAGADAVVDAFLNVVGAEGTVAVPTLTATYLESAGGPGGHVFDPKVTPSRVGSITNIFRQRPGAIRSLHPTHSVTAIGGRAAGYTAGHEFASTCGWESPYGRTVRWDGYICYFGTTTTTNTHLHAVEDWMGLPYMQDGIALVKGPDGETLHMKVRGAPFGPRDFYKDGSMIDAVLAASGIWKQIQIGSATVTLMKARDCVDVTFRALVRKPDLLLKKIDDPWTAAYRQKTIDYVGQRWGTVAPA